LRDRQVRRFDQRVVLGGIHDLGGLIRMWERSDI